MKTSIEGIRAKITELETKIADLRIAERELETLDVTPAPRTKPKATAKDQARYHPRDAVWRDLPMLCEKVDLFNISICLKGNCGIPQRVTFANSVPDVSGNLRLLCVGVRSR